MSREKMMRRMYICVIRLQYLRDERETEEDWRENIFRRGMGVATLTST